MDDTTVNLTAVIGMERTRSAAFFDVDGTLTSCRTWEGFLKYFKERHIRRYTHYAYLGYHYPLYFLRKLGLISEGSFRAPWAANMAWYVRGMALEEASAVWDFTIAYLAEFWREDSRAILDAHLQNGDLVVLVSSGPAPLLQRVARELGTEYYVGTEFEIKDGYYTGRSIKPTCIDSYKASMTKDYLEAKGLNVDFNASSAYADSIADLAMLEMAGHPVAVYPDNALRGIALQRGWRIHPA